MRNKGKQKLRLYKKRNIAKLERNKRVKQESAFVKRKDSLYSNSILGDKYTNVMNCLDRKNFRMSKFTHIKRRVERIVVPETFSISENTEDVINILRRIYTIGTSFDTKEIIFDHSNCKKLGLAASTLLDIIVVAVAKFRERKKQPLDLSGEMPKNKHVRDIFLAGGLPYHLQADYKMNYDERHVERFELVSGQNQAKTKRADETATMLTLYFNRCLKTQNLELNSEGNRLLSRIFGEVISNCEIHGGTESTWYTQGHYQTSVENSYGEMQLLFLTIGDTIYEGLKGESSKETLARLRHMLIKQKVHMNKQWTDEMIGTVFSLQEGISRLRDRNVEGYAGRGSGTVSMLEMFHTIGESEEGLKPQMTIVSGSTKIVFSDKYKMKFERFDNDEIFGTGEKRIIAFNEDNNIYAPPDLEAVKKINEHFPGTIISLRFYLDNRYIIRKKEGR